jgi:outer membrane protein W
MRALALSVLLLSRLALADEAVEPTPPASDQPAFHGFYFRVGGLFLQPLPSSQEVQLDGVKGAARLGLSDGPIAGSSVGLGNAAMPAITLGFAPSLPTIGQQLSLETILAIPFKMKLYAKGTLATKSLAPTVLGTLPTGVAALGEELGETTVAPPVLTAVYRFLPDYRVHPYVGLGVSVLIATDARITNPVLTEVATPTLEVPPAFGFVVQAGVDVHLWKWFFATADFKFIGGLDLTARVKDVYVRLPNLPLYGAVKVGDTVSHVSVNPVVLQLGVGMNL